MNYFSTRNKPPNRSKLKSFSEVVIEGLAPDGGLYLPCQIPDFKDSLEKLSELSYPNLALELFIPFLGAEYKKEEVRSLIKKSYLTFPKPPLKLVHLEQHSVLELFYGPTLSFKDYAMQFLGNLFEFILIKQNKPREKKQLNILGATSGDTGSAAIDSIRAKKNLAIFMLFPKEKISPIQKMQMSTVSDKNVFNLEVNGDFDDCQNIVKAIFGNLAFKKKYSLAAVNSINWARILAQITHYFYAALQFQKNFTTKEKVNFCVPTGNFGSVFAGYLAKKMGAPIDKIIIATNENNILTRLIETGNYSIKKTIATSSPAMDIQKASNFERYLYYLCNQDSKMLLDFMQQLQEKKSFQLNLEQKKKIQMDFLSGFATQKEVETTIKKYYEKENYLLDTHTAVGVSVAEKLNLKRTICLATAHPVKDYQPIEKIIKKKISFPPSIKQLFSKEQRVYKIDASLLKIENFIAEKLTPPID